MMLRFESIGRETINTRAMRNHKRYCTKIKYHRLISSRPYLTLAELHFQSDEYKFRLSCTPLSLIPNLQTIRVRNTRCMYIKSNGTTRGFFGQIKEMH